MRQLVQMHQVEMLFEEEAARPGVVAPHGLRALPGGESFGRRFPEDQLRSAQVDRRTRRSVRREQGDVVFRAAGKSAHPALGVDVIGSSHDAQADNCSSHYSTRLEELISSSVVWVTGGGCVRSRLSSSRLSSTSSPRSSTASSPR